MPADYIDLAHGGFPTRDYTMDPSDLAQMRTLGTSYVGRTPVPIIDTSAPHGSLLRDPYNNYTANGWEPDGQGGYVPPGTERTVMTSAGPSTLPRSGSTVGVRTGATLGVTSQPTIGAAPGALPLPATAPVPRSPQDQFQLQANNTEAARQAVWGQYGIPSLPKLSTKPEDADANAKLMAAYSASLDKAQRARVAFVPGGADLFNSYTAKNWGGGINVGSPSNLTDPSMLSAQGKKMIGDNRLDLDLINDPRFKRLQASNPENAERFYQAVTNRSLKGDSDAAVAQLAAQRTAQDKIANDVSKDLVVAQKDDPNTGVKAGMYAKRMIIQDPLNPGAMKLVNVPLTDVEAQSQGIGPDGEFSGDNPATRANGFLNSVAIAKLQREHATLTAAKAAEESKNKSATNSVVSDIINTSLNRGVYGPLQRQSPKFVPFDSPLYDDRSQASKDTSLYGQMWGQNLTTGLRVISNAGTRIGNYFGSGAPTAEAPDNDSYMRALEAQRQKEIDDGTDMGSWYHG